MLRPSICAGFLVFLASITTAAEPVLTTAREVRLLSRTELAKGYPVRLRGVVTYYEPIGSRVFLHDGTAGIYLGQVPRGWRAGIFAPGVNLRAGQQIEFTGISAAGRFSPSVLWPAGSEWPISVLGETPFPEPLRLTPGNLLNPRFQNEWVELQGIVRKVSVGFDYLPKPEHLADPTLPVRWEFTIQHGSELVEAILPNRPKTEPMPVELKDAEVRVRGVYAARFDSEGRQTGLEILIPTFEQLEILDAGAALFSDLPLREFDEILQFQNIDRRRVHVAGTVLYREPGRGFFLWSKAKTLWVESTQQSALVPGQYAEAVGFPGTVGGAICLRDATVREGAPGSLPEAQKIAEPSGELAHGNWIELEGETAGELDTAHGHTVLLRIGEALTEVRLPTTRSLNFRPGSQIRARGVWFKDPSGSRLMVPGPESLRLLRLPGWWTARRLGLAVSGALAAALIAMAWGVALRRKVAAQTRIISEKTQAETLAAERTRMARDLHDSVEQHLTGIATQLDLMASKLPAGESAPHTVLHRARALLRHARSEARHSVWDLRTLGHARGDLSVALRELIESMENEGGPRIHLEIRGSAPAPSPTTAQLLRIAQEALTNALKHARASAIQILLECAPGSVRLRVQDDGCGFKPNEDAAFGSGHFGLMGMQERADRLGARLELLSGSVGTTISVTLEEKSR